MTTDANVRHLESARSAVARLLTAIGSRDLRAISAALHPEATWQNVPHTAANGRAAVIGMLAPIITWSDRVRWDIITESYSDDVAWLERTDRFWIEGTEHIVQCNGVMTTDGNVVCSVRDYCDVGEWRARIGPIYERLASRSPREVVQHHLDAVASRNPIAMASDYGLDAVLERPAKSFVGHSAISDYFDTVPFRLGVSSLVFGDVESSPDLVKVPWQISNDRSSASGRDAYVVELGRIIRHTVTLDGSDF